MRAAHVLTLGSMYVALKSSDSLGIWLEIVSVTAMRLVCNGLYARA